MDLKQLADMYDFTGKTVVITGGAGILGGEIACTLVECGAKVAIVDLDPSLADRLADRLESGVGQAIVLHGNVLESDSLEETARQVTEAFGQIDCLINGAGGNSPIATTGPDQPGLARSSAIGGSSRIAGSFCIRDLAEPDLNPRSRSKRKSHSSRPATLPAAQRVEYQRCVLRKHAPASRQIG